MSYWLDGFVRSIWHHSVCNLNKRYIVTLKFLTEQQFTAACDRCDCVVEIFSICEMCIDCHHIIMNYDYIFNLDMTGYHVTSLALFRDC